MSNFPPIVHYILVGAEKGLDPHVLINTRAYATNFGLDLARTNPLVHYNMSEEKEGLVETPHFDRSYYVDRHPESEEFPGGPFQHFVSWGVRDGFRPSAGFNTKYYYARHLQGDYRQNAYLHYIETGAAQGLETDIPREVSTLARDVRHFSKPGPDFEEIDFDIARGRERRGKLIAFYLPQFHAIPENDEWWGKGFTEWRNLPRGLPRFAGHYQPRIPRDLSFYDLNDAGMIRRQVEMAKAMGIWGFAYYFYWFNRHRLLEGPLDRFLGDPSIDMPFMLIWANENWTRRWDGADSEVLIRQDHDQADDEALVDCIQKYFADPRYIRLGGRPWMVIYRADIIPDVHETLGRWRTLFKERHDEEPLIYLAQTFGAEDPSLYGFDGAIEFPPHKIGRTAQEINKYLQFHDWDYEGGVCRYSDAVKISLNEQPPSFPLVKTVFPSWDNNARRQTGGMVYHGATPQLFGNWLDGALQFARENPVANEEIVFINAWNEWCEGAYLEPDVYYGGAMLNKVASTLTLAADRDRPDKMKVLLVGHDAFPAGAQRLLLAIAKIMQNRFGIVVHVLLLAPGEMLAQYSDAVPTTLSSWSTLAADLKKLAEQGFDQAILNTVATGQAAIVLKELGFTTACLVHELPQIIEEYGLKAHAEAICAHADSVVFPTDFVREAFTEKVAVPESEVSLLPQGIYQPFDRDRDAGLRLRAALGIPDDAGVVLNVGHGDLRKGVDIFCQVAHLCHERGLDLHFVWAGSVHPALQSWLVADLERKGVGNLHFLGERTDIADVMNAADVLFLTSREDPFPSVILEAMQVGLPFVAFQGNGGFVELAEEHPFLGSLVPQADLGAAISQLASYADAKSRKSADIDRRMALARTEFDFGKYAFELLRLFDPDLKRVSAVVPNYNYERYLSARLSSIFDQTYPLFELIVLDDASTDDSVAELARITKASGHSFQVIRSDRNSGGAFPQWKKAAELATGELLWIAEADDLADADLVARLAEAFVEDAKSVFAFSDSRSVDEDGYKVYDSYVPYAEGIAPGVLSEDRVFGTKEFVHEALSIANLVLNVSGVLWKKEVLLRAFDRSEDELSDLRVAGDWRLYLAACAETDGRISYVADPLNIHRRHRSSITQSLDVERHLEEIGAMQSLANQFAGRDRKRAGLQRKYLTDVAKWLRRS